MSFDEAVARLRSWEGVPVTVVLEPEGTILAGRLRELDSSGIDGALFAVDGDPAARRSGVALALFRDTALATSRGDDELVVRQGRVTATVALA